MAKPKSVPMLVATAAALDEHLRAYETLAREASRLEITDERSLVRAAALMEQSTKLQPHIQETLRALVVEIEAARDRQQLSLDALVTVSKSLEARAADFDAIMRRFAELGHAASVVNQLTADLSARRAAEVLESDLLRGRDLNESMNKLVVDAEQLARDAEEKGWSDIASQADAVRQQVRSANNKLNLAYKAVVAARHPDGASIT